MQERYPHGPRSTLHYSLQTEIIDLFKELRLKLSIMFYHFGVTETIDDVRFKIRRRSSGNSTYASNRETIISWTKIYFI